MKIITIMYLHDTFHLKKKLGRDLLEVGARGRRTSEKKSKNRFLGFISWDFQDYIKNSVICDTLPCTASLVQILKNSDNIWGSYTQKTTQKQPKIHFSGPTKTFENY